MAINLQVKTAISIDEPVTVQELRAAVGRRKVTAVKRAENARQSECVVSEAVVKPKDVRLCKVVSDNKAVKYIEKSVKSSQKKRRRSKTSKDEDFEKVLRDNKIRKYTKEMQNRDAIVKNSKAMRKRAQTTVSNYDDKFAEAAAAPTKQFDSIIYGSVTVNDAENMLDDIFTEVMDASK